MLLDLQEILGKTILIDESANWPWLTAVFSYFATIIFGFDFFLNAKT